MGENFEMLEKLPNSSYEIAIDDRGITVEGPNDPLYGCDSLKEVFHIWNFTDSQIDEYFENKYRAKIKTNPERVWKYPNIGPLAA